MKDSAIAENFPAAMKGYVINAKLKNRHFSIAASDLINDTLVNGNGMAIMISCSNEVEFKKLYGNLSKGGKCLTKISINNYGHTIGNVMDRFGKEWVIVHSRES